ncbi:MAG: biotin--[acetyl-CoA-carboxylase] ligase [Polyangiaceae bacterium]|nr:biotin--[acetyl-CoA-carboxylase] ligase [Polyangiaceae bacterium]
MTAFDVARFAALRRERGLGLGEPLKAVAETGSTNDDAMDAARAGAPHGATFVADAQTRGRGRRGARWTSPPGQNLLCSVLLRPGLSPELTGTLTLAVGLAVREVAAARIAADVRVKWPNDVLVDDRKLAGILLESQLDAGQVTAIVVGVGLNVGMSQLPPELRGVATSLALLGDRDPRREEVLIELLAALERRVAAHAQGGLAPVLAELARVDALAGRRVRADRVEGVAAGIAPDGALRVRTDDGVEARVCSGGVVLI